MNGWPRAGDSMVKFAAPLRSDVLERSLPEPARLRRNVTRGARPRRRGRTGARRGGERRNSTPWRPMTADQAINKAGKIIFYGWMALLIRAGIVSAPRRTKLSWRGFRSRFVNEALLHSKVSTSFRPPGLCGILLRPHFLAAQIAARPGGLARRRFLDPNFHRDRL